MKENIKRLNIPVPNELHKKLRIVAAENETTISEIVIQAILDKIEPEKEGE